MTGEHLVTDLFLEGSPRACRSARVSTHDAREGDVRYGFDYRQRTPRHHDGARCLGASTGDIWFAFPRSGTGTWLPFR
ncbi:hypothetical protein [Streptomyces incanus]|uniref:Uncharacterized protein n=1 Tax=Streptomyces incanus TaxID=887453 RepID=A0ABW0XMY9_9ACTN